MGQWEGHGSLYQELWEPHLPAGGQRNSERKQPGKQGAGGEDESPFYTPGAREDRESAAAAAGGGGPADSLLP